MDTTFILPFFGIEVAEIYPETLEAIELAHNVEFIYPKLMVAELIAKIAKECKKQSFYPQTIEDDIINFLATPEITLIEPKPEHLIFAIKLRYLGHPDIFDCVAYATALTENALFLTIDTNLIQFIRNNHMKTRIFLTQHQFTKIVKQKNR